MKTLSWFNKKGNFRQFATYRHTFYTPCITYNSCIPLGNTIFISFLCFYFLIAYKTDNNLKNHISKFILPTIIVDFNKNSIFKFWEMNITYCFLSKRKLLIYRTFNYGKRNHK